MAKSAMALYSYFMKVTFLLIALLLYGLLPHCAAEESVRVESNEEDGANPVSNRGLRFRRRRHQINQEAPRLHSVFPSCLFLRLTRSPFTTDALKKALSPTCPAS